MVGRDLQGRRFDSLVTRASEPWRMLAICVIGQALDDISPKNGRMAELTATLADQADLALAWVEGVPAPMPSILACQLAGINLDLLRSEAATRAALRWPAVEGTAAA